MAKSDIGDSPVTKLQLQVEHRDPVLKYTASGNAGGEEFTEAETLNTNGKPTTDSRGARSKVIGQARPW